jgi:hypothetical protein
MARAVFVCRLQSMQYTPSSTIVHSAFERVCCEILVSFEDQAFANALDNFVVSFQCLLDYLCVSLLLGCACFACQDESLGQRK